MPNGECVVGATNAANIKALSEAQALSQTSLHEVDEQQWEAINKIRDRLPAWATALLMILTGIVGVLGTLVAT